MKSNVIEEQTDCPLHDHQLPALAKTEEDENRRMVLARPQVVEVLLPKHTRNYTKAVPSAGTVGAGGGKSVILWILGIGQITMPAVGLWQPDSDRTPDLTAQQSPDEEYSAGGSDSGCHLARHDTCRTVFCRCRTNAFRHLSSELAVPYCSGSIPPPPAGERDGQSPACGAACRPFPRRSSPVASAPLWPVRSSCDLPAPA